MKLPQQYTQNKDTNKQLSSESFNHRFLPVIWPSKRVFFENDKVKRLVPIAAIIYTVQVSAVKGLNCTTGVMSYEFSAEVNNTHCLSPVFKTTIHFPTLYPFEI